MKKHYQRATRPLTVTAAIFGFALIEYPEGEPRRLLSLLCAIVSFSLQVAMLSTKFLYLEVYDDIFLRTVRFTILGYISLHILVLACFSQFHGKRYQQCLEAMNEIDETLKGLKIETDYSRLRRVVIVTLVTWMCWLFILNAVGTVVFSKDTNQIYVQIVTCILNIPLHTPFIINICFWFVVGYAGTRFDCINSALKELALDNNNYIRRVRNKKVTSIRGVSILNEKNKRIIWTMMHLHFRLCDILCNITRLFDTQLYIEIGFSFQFLLYSMIFTLRVILFPSEENKYEYCVLLWMWAVLFTLKLFTTNYICENIAGKAMTVSDIAVKLICDMDDEKMREDLLLIGLQTKHKPLRFSCLGLDYFGYQFFYTIVSMMVSLIVIILQWGTGPK